MAKTTRTLNPLHFEDLEPRRFEDLVRQLIYDLRPWRSLEATGRLGADEGVDIRAIEVVQRQFDSEITEELDEEERPVLVERLWTVQCKREREIGPSRIQTIIEESVPADAPTPYGFILAAACDFSAKTRSRFRERLIERGVEEFYLFGKAELEDLLFQPRNDHLLFAYFDISLRIRRRSAKAVAASRLATKRRLSKTIGSIEADFGNEPVLIRNSEDSRYPWVGDVPDFESSTPWRYYRFAGHLRPDYIGFVAREHYAYVNWETKEFDYLPKYDAAWPSHPRLVGYEPKVDRDEEENARKFWHTRVPEGNRALLRVYGMIPYDSIVLVDDVGDSYHPAPHLLVDFAQRRTPFELARARFESADGNERRILYQDDGRRVAYFPKEIPEVTFQEFSEALDAKYKR